MALTKEQIERYMKNPNLCPFCQSTQIAGEQLEVNDGSAFQPVSCLSCGKDWEDNYTLTSVTSNVE